MRPRGLLLVPVGPSDRDPGLIGWLGEEIRAELGLEPARGEPLPLRDAWLDPDRGQYSSNHVVDALIERSTPAGDPPPEEWILGVTDADLFADDRDFVFGEATLGGHWALIGLARLAGDGRELLRRRARKEALHELGHLAGLGHCDRPACAMAESPDLAHLDSKGEHLCPACHARFGVSSRLVGGPAEG